MREWQERPLDACYPVVILDALRVKIRDEGVVQKKAVYVALGISPSDQKEILGLWVRRPKARPSGTACSPSSRVAVWRTS